MDDLLAKERAAQKYVISLQAHADNLHVPFQVTLDAFTAYRSAVQDVTLADILRGEPHERLLWEQHVSTRQLLARTLRELRKRPEQKTVEIRVAVEMYLRFLKHAIRFYRRYIQQLSVRYGGLPELEKVAQKVKQDQALGSSSQHIFAPDVREQVLRSCYRSLIYLGDLCRYRAADKLDKVQDFGPAVGYYGLACTLMPTSGWGHNQQALVALETKQYLPASYHLYKALLVAEPVPHAKKSLFLHFDRSNAAWEKGELIQKDLPGDPNAGKQALIGLFVRLHSVCASGEQYRGYAELEHELLNRLKTELQSRSLDSALHRMVLVNIGAQHFTMDNYRELQNAKNEQAFYYFMRINVVFFTAFLDLFHNDLLKVAADQALVDADLEEKLKPTMLRTLAALRLYSAWLVLNSHLLLGLASNDFLSAAIQTFWRTYTHTLDLVAHCFPIWDLEDIDAADHMLKEDLETVGFTPLDDPQAPKLVRKIFVQPEFQTSKASLSDTAVSTVEDANEALTRVLSILETGSYIANDVEESPVFIKGARFVLGSAHAPYFDIPVPPKPEAPKPLSYAAAAQKVSSMPKLAPGHTRPTSSTTPGALLEHSSSRGSRTSQDEAHLLRMVDSLVEEDETDHPVTPPQAYASNPTVVLGHGDLAELPVLAASPKIGAGIISMPLLTAAPVVHSKQQKATRTTGVKRSEDLSDFSPRPRRPGSGQLWSPSSPQLTPTPLPSKSANSPKQTPHSSSRSPHERNSSNASVHPTTPMTFDDAAKPVRNINAVQQQRPSNARKQSTEPPDSGRNDVPSERLQTSPGRSGSAHIASPLLFGSGSIWSAMPATNNESAS